MSQPDGLDQDGRTPALTGPVTYAAIAASFFRLGTTTFGGMWGATRHIEIELVERRGWLTPDELRIYLVTATLVPSPKFMGLGGLVGYKLRGLVGSAVAVLSLITPGALMVLLAVVTISPQMLSEHLGPMQRSVGIGVAGIMFGTAGRQLNSEKVKGRTRFAGLVLAFAVATALIAGAPFFVVVAAGFAVGVVAIKGSRR